MPYPFIQRRAKEIEKNIVALQVAVDGEKESTYYLDMMECTQAGQIRRTMMQVQLNRPLHISDAREFLAPLDQAEGWLFSQNGNSMEVEEAADWLISFIAESSRAPLYDHTKQLKDIHLATRLSDFVNPNQEEYHGDFRSGFHALDFLLEHVVDLDLNHPVLSHKSGRAWRQECLDWSTTHMKRLLAHNVDPVKYQHLYDLPLFIGYDPATHRFRAEHAPQAYVQEIKSLWYHSEIKNNWNSSVLRSPSLLSFWQPHMNDSMREDVDLCMGSYWRDLWRAASTSASVKEHPHFEMLDIWAKNWGFNLKDSMAAQAQRYPEMPPHAHLSNIYFPGSISHWVVIGGLEGYTELSEFLNNSALNDMFKDGYQQFLDHRVPPPAPEIAPTPVDLQHLFGTP